MIENQSSKEKLLTMLTEIYDQLEELEEVLDCSLSDLRDDLYQQHSNNVAKIEEKIVMKEQKYHRHISATKCEKETNQSIPQNLKLELGF
ncbi:hypothetical protein ACFSO7_17815 [Bacillus sp. CGMCC 1.16607]|uniref:hypothetical protein n=1 Tax=Bacillus sp. CGMCC 1.16607 TaxID=3351842 RepID=UPI003638670D